MDVQRPPVQIYLTSEQAHRLSALACDALVGLQVEGDVESDSTIIGTYVDFDERPRSFSIAYDGSYVDTT